MSKLSDLDQLKLEVCNHLPDYLLSQGIPYMTGKNFQCICGTHEDNNPSMGLFQADGKWLFHCFACGATGDIMKAAHFQEGLPLEGPGFVYDNLFVLAKRFGIQTPELSLSEEQVYELQIYRGYQEASHIIVASSNDLVAERLQTHYGWQKETVENLGIGTVISYDDYMSRMVAAGFKKDFLHTVDLDNKKLFSPTNLIYTVKDEWGRPVGFAARSLLYDAADEAWKAAVDLFGENSAQAAAAKAKIPSKYYNTADHHGTQVKNPIYQKGKRLFGLHTAKKQMGPLWIFEGYADCATAQDRGLKRSCAIGSTKFTDDHLELIFNELGVKHVIFVLDADEAGKKGIDEFVKKVDEKLAGHIGFNVEIVEMPAGSDDPDKMIREQGVKAFRDLPRVSMFSWRLLRMLDDPAALENIPGTVETMAKLIINEPMPPIRYKLCQEVADKLHIPVEVVYDTVQMLVNEDRMRMEEQKTVLAKKISDDLKKHPENLHIIIEKAAGTLESMGSDTIGYNPNSYLSYVRQCRNEARSAESARRLPTGWSLFDDHFGGIPVKDTFISVPGKPNQGKSSLMVNIFWRVVENNPDAICFYHTMDDAMSIFLPRVLGSRWGLPSHYFQEPQAYTDDLKYNQQLAKIEEAEAWLDEMFASQRLIAADTKILPRDLGALTMALRDIRKLFPTRPLIVFGDNFHHYDFRNSSAPSEGEAKTAYIARYGKELTVRYSCTIFMTMELTKKDLDPGVRPRISTLKGSSAMAYEASGNIGVYNDMKDFGPKSLMYWEDPNNLEAVLGPGGITEMKPAKKPIVELVFDKSKIYKGYDGVIYFRLDPRTGRYEECTDQAHWEQMAQMDVGTPEPDEQPAWKKKYDKPKGQSKPPKPMPTPFFLSDDDSAVHL
jgi:DNA primase